MITVTDFIDPDIDNVGKVHDWKNYLSTDLWAIWESFSEYQKQVIAEKYKGKVNNAVYESLINWNVEVTD